MNAMRRLDVNRRRYLEVTTHGVTMALFWNSVHLAPRVRLHWFADYRLNVIGAAHYIEVGVSPGFDAGCYARANICDGVQSYVRDETTYAYRTPTTQLTLQPGEPEAFTELLSLARSVAAGHAPAEAILGLIEDRFQHPWSLLATDNPLSCLETLCRCNGAL